MTRTFRHPSVDLLNGRRIETLSAARIIAEVVGAPVAGLSSMTACELADGIAAAWRLMTGRSIHEQEGAVLVVERDRCGRVIRHRVEGAAA